MKGRCAISDSCDNEQRKKKTKLSPSSGLCSLPDELVLNCLAQISRFDLAALAIASKSHRSLVDSPELSDLRHSNGFCTESCLYLCLRIIPEPAPRWFILTPYHRLYPIPSNPNQAPEASSFVVVDQGIYVFGGLINGSRTSDVWFLDCFSPTRRMSHTWRRAPSMTMARASACASLLDGKIYVFGGCAEYADSSNWAEIFDLKTQTWGHWYIPKMRYDIHQSVVVEEEKTVYAVDVERRTFYLVPSKSMFWGVGRTESKFGSRNDWCAIGNLLYCRNTPGRVMWCEAGAFDWREVEGLEELQVAWRQILYDLNPGSTKVEFDIIRLCSNSAGNIVIFWNAYREHPEALELWSAELSMEKRQGGEIWAKIEWSRPLYKLDLHSHPNQHAGLKFYNRGKGTTVGSLSKRTYHTRLNQGSKTKEENHHRGFKTCSKAASRKSLTVRRECADLGFQAMQLRRNVKIPNFLLIHWITMYRIGNQFWATLMEDVKGKEIIDDAPTENKVSDEMENRKQPSPE
ncbi:unnamed protein product [Arabis nemorensis]|uniref:F-box domain-containing protein n=1 Tax=Arabis nemorensis TaxID=586526 RepID=A0A565B1V5_9BRAS|nr:unnamed protein product [Arabis nemorensis]